MLVPANNQSPNPEDHPLISLLYKKTYHFESSKDLESCVFGTRNTSQIFLVISELLQIG